MRGQRIPVALTVEDAQIVLACLSCVAVQATSSLHTGTKKQTMDRMDEIAAIETLKTKIVRAVNEVAA